MSITKLKVLTLLAVQSAMDLLIHANEKTSTLLVKGILRDLGYEANQADVSKMMKDIYSKNKDKYDRVGAGHFFEYKFKPVASDDDSDASSVTVNPNTSKNANSATSTPVIQSDGKEMPKTYFHKDELQGIVSSYKHKDDWIVNKADLDDDDKIHYLIFDSKMTRDKVRSRFATLNKVKINGVRARRLYNAQDL